MTDRPDQYDPTRPPENQPAGPSSPPSPGASTPPPVYGTPSMPSYSQAPPPPAGEYRLGDPAAMPQGLVAAPWWKRLVARLIDIALSLAVSGLLWSVLGESYVRKVEISSGDSTMVSYQTTPLGMLIGLVLGILTEVVLVALLGGQIGKLLMGIRIADAQTGKIGPGWGRAIGRWLLLSVAFAACFVPGLILCLSPLWTGPRRQGYHDKAVGTLVVEKP